MPDDAERARHVVEQFGHVLAQVAEHAAAFDARTGGVAGRGMLDDVARQRRWKWAPRGLARRRPSVLRLRPWLGLGDPLVEVGHVSSSCSSWSRSFSDERPNATRNARANLARSASIS